jgi:solute carrier family 25 protein 14/30
MREATYSSVRMGLYDYFRGVVAPAGTRKQDFTLSHKIAAGVMSGALGSSFATPIDLMKIRFQSFSLTNPNPYRNTLQAFIQTARRGGLAGLYKGVGPTTLRAAVLNSSCLASYDHSKAWMIRGRYGEDGIATHLFASIVSGLVTTTTVNPFDVIKTRIMTDGTSRETAGRTRYRNAFHCAYETARNEGIVAFSKGWLPNYLRLGPHFILSLPLAEFIRLQLGADTI